MQPISFITNTGANTLEYTKLLLESLKINLIGQLFHINNQNERMFDYEVASLFIVT